MIRGMTHEMVLRQEVNNSKLQPYCGYFTNKEPEKGPSYVCAVSSRNRRHSLFQGWEQKPSATLVSSI